MSLHLSWKKTNPKKRIQLKPTAPKITENKELQGFDVSQQQTLGIQKQ